MSFKVFLTLGSETNSARAETLAGALAVAKAFELQHFDNRDAQTGVWDNDTGRYVHKWIGATVFGPRDARRPMECLMTRAIRSGERVVISDGHDTWRFNNDF